MKRVIIKINTFIFLLLFSISANSDDILNHLTYDDKNTFYIKSPEDILKSDSVTYFIDSKPVDKKVKKIFYDFSNLVGKKNGVISISFDESKELKIMDFMLLSNCKFLLYKLPVIVYEDRLKKSCYSFENIKNDDLYLILSSLYKSVKNKENITADYVKIKLKEILPGVVDKKNHESTLKLIISFVYSLFEL
jgi:hypothetical protein